MTGDVHVMILVLMTHWWISIFVQLVMGTHPDQWCLFQMKNYNDYTVKSVLIGHKRYYCCNKKVYVYVITSLGHCCVIENV